MWRLCHGVALTWRHFVTRSSCLLSVTLDVYTPDVTEVVQRVRVTHTYTRRLHVQLWHWKSSKWSQVDGKTWQPRRLSACGTTWQASHWWPRTEASQLTNELRTLCRSWSPVELSWVELSSTDQDSTHHYPFYPSHQSQLGLLLARTWPSSNCYRSYRAQRLTGVVDESF